LEATLGTYQGYFFFWLVSMDGWDGMDGWMDNEDVFYRTHPISILLAPTLESFGFDDSQFSNK
jgi:hypothetical protein